MIITELDDGGSEDSRVRGEIVKAKAKIVLVGAGARMLFYPTLLYNVIRNKLQTEFRWWDEVDQYVLLGAVPFPSDVPLLRHLGVTGVITLNEPYETLVPSSLYKAHGIDHLVIPTRDYLYSPSLIDICLAVDFIHDNASHGMTTYVHCKAGRGRSTTIVLCYLVEYKHMTPEAALEYVRSKRPRVLLHLSQWQAVLEYSRRKAEFPAIQSQSPTVPLAGDEVFITAADLDGYSMDEDAKNMSISSCHIAQAHAVIVNYMPINTAVEDEVFVTEADLEGYDNFVITCKTAGAVPDSTEQTKLKPMTKRLSCLFASLKISANSQQVTSRILEIPSC